MREVVIGLLGAGNVGGGVVRILQENQADIERRLGASVRVKKLLVRSVDGDRDDSVPRHLLTTDPREILEDPEIRIVVELMGGIEPALTMVLDALGRSKHVVTANKALMATHGEQLFSEAQRRGVSINFEAAVAGGIPILRALREGLASDRIERITGIVNGTCNYILDAMSRTGAAYEDALKAAQDAGFAEADPALDVGGGDAAQKLSLLALLSFGQRVDPEAIPTEGITRVRAFDIAAADGLGYVIKSLAEARQTPEGPALRVHPVLVPKEHILATVRGSYNAVLVESRAMGRSLYHGRGAGPMPTGMAVVSDIIELCRHMFAFDAGRPPPEAFATVETATPISLDEVAHENYLCVHVTNVPGILGRVASCLGRHGVSVKRLEQELGGVGDPVDMVVVTERVPESNVRSAVAEIDGFDEVLAPSHRFRIQGPDGAE
ncbi:MAG: homoserine dehydrogenase [Nannocystaceae bacterium]|nr:homoserine dehydrogenase [bacterium]